MVRRSERRIGGQCRLVLERDRNGGWTARLAGDLDRFDAGDLTSALGSVLLSSEVSVDLDGVTFLDLAAGRVLQAFVGSADGVRVVASPSTPGGRLLAWLAEHERDGAGRP
jgi:hypothetical protein